MILLLCFASCRRTSTRTAPEQQEQCVVVRRTTVLAGATPKKLARALAVRILYGVGFFEILSYRTTHAQSKPGAQVVAVVGHRV